MASATGTTATGGIPAFYQAIWSEARAHRRQVAIAVEATMVIAWFVVRTFAGTDGRAYMVWVVAAGILALVAPRSGLVVFIATSVFFEPADLTRILAPRQLVVVPLAIGVLVQVAADRFRWRPALAIWLALLLALGTGLGVVRTFALFDQEIQWQAAQSWIGNMLAPVVILVAAAWTARDGSIRALVVATGVGVVAALVSLIEYAAPGSVSGGPLAWVGFWKDFGARLAGTIPSPNALSAQLIVPTMILLAAVLLARDVRLRLIALGAVTPLLVANYLTYSRSPLVGLYAFVVIVGWRFRRAVGIAVLLGGLVVGAALLPSYLALRSQSTTAQVVPGTILVATDQYRIQAWGAAVAMWADQPLVGQGFLAYKELGDLFGDPLMGSPHNEWLRLFAEEGTIVGLVGIAFIVAAAWVLARVPGWLGTGILAGFVSYVIAASFNNPLLFVRVSAVAFATFGVGFALAERARAQDIVAETAIAAEQSNAAEPESPGSGPDATVH